MSVCVCVCVSVCMFESMRLCVHVTDILAYMYEQIVYIPWSTYVYDHNTTLCLSAFFLNLNCVFVKKKS